MRLTRWDELTFAQRELLRVRLKRASRTGFLFGVSMGLAHLPNSILSLGDPSDPRWWPLLVGVAQGLWFFAVDFLVLSRLRFLRHENDGTEELEALAREELAARETRQVGSSNDPR
jgi:hypothetical protein